jgi:hypothetical protein
MSRTSFKPQWNDTIEGIQAYQAKKYKHQSIGMGGHKLEGMKHLPKPANFKRGPTNVFCESFYDNE